MSQDRHLRFDIFQVLADHAPLNTPQITELTGADGKIVSKNLWYLVYSGFLTVDKTERRNYLYDLSAEGRQRLAEHRGERPVTLAPNQVPMPPQLRGPVLSPMAWSLRHLLGAV